jgi:hypothetical protein
MLNQRNWLNLKNCSTRRKDSCIQVLLAWKPNFRGGCPAWQMAGHRLRCNYSQWWAGGDASDFYFLVLKCFSVLQVSKTKTVISLGHFCHWFIIYYTMHRLEDQSSCHKTLMLMAKLPTMSKYKLFNNENTHFLCLASYVIHSCYLSSPCCAIEHQNFSLLSFCTCWLPFSHSFLSNSFLPLLWRLFGNHHFTPYFYEASFVRFHMNVIMHLSSCASHISLNIMFSSFIHIENDKIPTTFMAK